MNQTLARRERPLFLTIICILSFIGLGLSIFNNLTTSLVFQTIPIPFEFIQEEINTSLEQEDIPNSIYQFILKIKDDIFELLEKIPTIALITALFAIVALIGTVYMWQLKKQGFYLYLTGKILMVLTPVFVCGGNFVASIISLSNGFFAAIFVTLYAVNFKYLK